MDFLRLYGHEPIHDGLVVIVPNVSRREQDLLFRLVLERLETLPDLIDQVLEIQADHSITIRSLVAP